MAIRKPTGALKVVLWLMGLLVMCGGICLAPVAHNIRKFDKFRRTVEQIPLPPQTELIMKSEEFGNLWGTSNGCYHQVRILIASELDVDAVKGHYAGFSVGNPDENDSGKVRARIIPFKGTPDFEASGQEFFYPLFPSTDYNWYIVEYEGYTEPGWDLRCG